jgi:peptide/nickel transport system ATP-binding protein
MSDASAIFDAEVAYQPTPANATRPVPARADPQGRPPLIEVENLNVRFGPDGPLVVKGASFTLHRGEVLAIVGESGSGKSVTSRTLVGLAGQHARITADKLSFAQQDLASFSPRHWREVRGGRIGFVMQDALGSLDPLKLVGAEIGESLRLHTTLTREQRDAKVIDLLKSVGIPEPELRARQYPHQLSGGLRQRALIAAAIACGPELLIADEPTTALDAAVQAQVLDLLESLHTPDNAMIVVSHDFAVVSRLADRVAVMHRGVIVEQGPIEEVLNNPRHPYTRSLLGAVKSVHGRGKTHRPRPLTLAEHDNQIGFTPISRSTGPAIVQVEGLTKAFTGPDAKSRTVVSDVSFQLRAGETIGIVGESGSGKTTTIRMILGLEKPDRGSVHLHGLDWLGLSGRDQRNARRRMQVIFQDPLASFDPRYTVERVIGEALGVAGFTDSAQRRTRTIELLKLVRLDETYLTRRPIELSGGQRQRIAIARALAPEPEILVCDEPVSALDVSVQKQILDLLAHLKARLGLSCLFISHDLGVIHRISDRVLVMKDGVVVESGPVSEVFSNPQHAYTRTLLSAIPQLDFKGNAIYI